MFTDFFSNRKLQRHVSTVDKHYTALHNRYMTVYGEMLDASRSKNPDDMLAYLAKNAGIKNGMKLLDAGCGVCGPARYFASHFKISIEAITATKLQSEGAIQKNTEANLARVINVTHGDFHFLSKFYPANSFDIVYFLESFCHSYNVQKVIDETYKVLKPGGVIYMKEYFLTDRLKERDKALYEFVKRRFNEFYSFNFKEGINELGSVESYLNKHGFKVEFGRVPGYETDNYEVASLFHGHNDTYGRNDEYIDNTLGCDLRDVLDVVEIFELKAVKK